MNNSAYSFRKTWLAAASFALLCLCFLLILPTSVSQAADKAHGPNTSDKSVSFIAFATKANDVKNGKIQYVYCSRGAKASKVKGLSYNKKTNTLTVKSFKGIYIVANEMGDDFKVKLSGKSSLEFMTVYGYGYGGSLEFTGKGTLAINNSGKYTYQKSALQLSSENTESTLKVGKQVTLNLKTKGKSKKGYSALKITGNKLQKADSVLKNAKLSAGKLKKSVNDTASVQSMLVFEQDIQGFTVKQNGRLYYAGVFFEKLDDSKYYSNSGYVISVGLSGYEAKEYFVLPPNNSLIDVLTAKGYELSKTKTGLFDYTLSKTSVKITGR